MSEPSVSAVDELLEDLWMAAHKQGAIIVTPTEAIVRDGDREWKAPTLVEAIRKVQDFEDAQPDTVTINLVVNGQPVTRRYVECTPLSHVVQHVLHEYGHVGNREWQLRNSQGELLDQSILVREAAFLYLSLAAGVAAAKEPLGQVPCSKCEQLVTIGEPHECVR